MRFLKTLIAFLPLVLAACASKPPVIEFRTIHGVTFDTLQGSVNISLSSPQGKIGGNGMLFFQRPDSFRISILAPFGQSLFDIIGSGDRLLCLSEGKKKVWQGAMADLPEGFGAGIWPLFRWVVEPPPPAGAAFERRFTRADGTVEQLSYNSSGFVLKKLNSSGDRVSYGDYRVIDGIAVPMEIELYTGSNISLKLVLDEPEVNRPVDPVIFAPSLEGYEIQPIASFRGF